MATSSVAKANTPPPSTPLDFQTLLSRFRFPAPSPKASASPPARDLPVAGVPASLASAAAAPAPRTPSPTRKRRLSGSASPASSPSSSPSPKRTSAKRSCPTTATRDGESRYFTEEGESTEGTEEDVKPAKKKKKPARGYADPTVYAHLDGVSDLWGPALDLVLVGINPGVTSAQTGNHYASPTNHFWKALHGAGFTERRLLPSEGYLLPQDYNIGSTNLVPRPSAEMSELSKAEMKQCVPALLQKLIVARPQWVAFVGMGICEIVAGYLRDFASSTSEASTSATPPPPSSSSSPSTSPKKRAKAIKIKCGVQPFVVTLPPKVEGEERETMYFFALPSTSARVVAYQIEDKIKIWKELKDQVDASKAGSATPKIPEGLGEFRAEDLVGLEIATPAPPIQVPVIKVEMVELGDLKPEDFEGVEEKPSV